MKHANKTDVEENKAAKRSKSTSASASQLMKHTQQDRKRRVAQFAESFQLKKNFLLFLYRFKLVLINKK